MLSESEISPRATRTRSSAWHTRATLGVLQDPDLIATASIAIIGLLVTAILIRATEGTDLAVAFLAPLN